MAENDGVGSQVVDHQPHLRRLEHVVMQQVANAFLYVCRPFQQVVVSRKQAVHVVNKHQRVGHDRVLARLVELLSSHGNRRKQN